MSERSLGWIARGQDAFQDVHNPALLLDQKNKSVFFT
jgi:hypothetical protein